MNIIMFIVDGPSMHIWADSRPCSSIGIISMFDFIKQVDETYYAYGREYFRDDGNHWPNHYLVYTISEGMYDAAIRGNVHPVMYATYQGRVGYR